MKANRITRVTPHAGRQEACCARPSRHRFLVHTHTSTCVHVLVSVWARYLFKFFKKASHKKKSLPFTILLSNPSHIPSWHSVLILLDLCDTHRGTCHLHCWICPYFSWKVIFFPRIPTITGEISMSTTLTSELMVN